MKTVKYLSPKGFREFAEAAHSINCWSKYFDVEKSLPDFYEMVRNEKQRDPSAYETIKERYSNDSFRAKYEWRRRVFKKQIVNKPLAFRRYFLGNKLAKDLSLNEARNLAIDYEYFRQNVIIIRSMLTMREVEQSCEQSLKGFRLVVPSMKTVSLGEDGTFRFDGGEEMLEGVKANRILTCTSCSNIFWAERLGTKYCSVNCGVAARQRRFMSQVKSKLRNITEVEAKQNGDI